MAKRDDDDSKLPTPWAIGSWLVPGFWLVVLIGAGLLIWFK